MPRYEVMDPTGEGFPQVVDVSNRSEPFKKTILNDAGIETEIEVCVPINRRLPMVRVVASFTPYMPNPYEEAKALCDRLNQGEPSPTVPQMKLRRIAISVCGGVCYYCCWAAAAAIGAGLFLIVQWIWRLFK